MGVRARPMAWWELASVSRADRITEGAAKATGARRAYAEACITARTLLSSGDASGAIATLEPVVAESPTSIDAHRLLGIALLETGEFSRARRPFEVALEGDPNDLIAQVGIAEVEEATEVSAVAFRAWRRAWEIEPGFEPVSARLRDIRRAQLAEGSATAPFTTDGSIDGPIAHTHPSLARARLRAGLHHHAMLDAMEALRQDRSRVDIQLLLAEAWWRSGESEVAHDVAASILEVAPNCVAANLLVAVHRRSVSRDPRQQVERARQADPFDRIAHQLFAGRDVPPIMDDAWGGDQWSASRASYGEWPLVAVMPRAVAVVRAQLAAEKAAAEAAEQARLEAEAEARRRKAAEEAAKKPAAGAFKGTGVITDTPAKPGGDKAEGADGGASPPKPSGFKGIGVIAEEEPVFKSKSRRPPGMPPAAEPTASTAAPAAPVASDPGPPADSPAPATDSPAPATVTAEAAAASSPPVAAASASAPTSGDALAAAGATLADHAAPPPNEPVLSSPSEPVPPVDAGSATSMPAPVAEHVPPTEASPTPSPKDSTQPVGPEAVAHLSAPNPAGHQTNADGAHGADHASVSTAAVEATVQTSGGSPAHADLAPASAQASVAAPAASRLFDTEDPATVRASADAAFHERRFTEAVRAYASLLRRM